MMQNKPQPEAQTEVAAPTQVPPTATPTPFDEDRAATELEGKPIPETAADIEAEIELLDQTVNDGSETNFNDTTLEGVDE